MSTLNPYVRESHEAAINPSVAPAAAPTGCSYSGCDLIGGRIGASVEQLDRVIEHLDAQRLVSDQPFQSRVFKLEILYPFSGSGPRAGRSAPPPIVGLLTDCQFLADFADSRPCRHLGFRLAQLLGDLLRRMALGCH
jgi:hypothetical protein